MTHHRTHRDVPETLVNFLPLLIDYRTQRSPIRLNAISHAIFWTRPLRRRGQFDPTPLEAHLPARRHHYSGDLRPQQQSRGLLRSSSSPRDGRHSLQRVAPRDQEGRRQDLLPSPWDRS